MSQRPEGLRTSARPPGRLAARWLGMLDHLDERLKGRLMRGKTLARAGRVAHLDLAPGAAFGDVQDATPQRVTVRVRTFDDREWEAVIATLSSRLSWLALLLEGTVSEDLLAALEVARVPMVPQASEIDGDCDCGDWAVPCAHGAALHHVIGEALDGEPFLLFTLRGRTRDQLLSDLRRSWGDSATTRGPAPERDEAPDPDGDPFASPIPPPLLTFRFGQDAGPPAILELGPLPGDEDLLRALHPLYEAGSAAAMALALAEPTGEPHRRRRRSTVPSVVPRPFGSGSGTPSEKGTPAGASAKSTPVVATPPPPSPTSSNRSGTPAPAPNRSGGASSAERGGRPIDANDGHSSVRTSTGPGSTAKRPDKQDHTERIVDALDRSPEGATAADLANSLGLPASRVTRDLGELEELGIVYRTGRGSSARWFVG